MTTIPYPRVSPEGASPVAPCPPWCARGAGHDLADRDPDDGAVRRVHLGPVVAGAQREQFETITRHGAVTLGAARHVPVTEAPAEAAEPVTVDPDDVTGCPRAAVCEACGAADELEIVTAGTTLGLLCVTVCGDCDGLPSMPLGVVLERVLGHAAHLGADLDEIAAALDAKDGDR